MLGLKAGGFGFDLTAVDQFSSAILVNLSAAICMRVHKVSCTAASQQTNVHALSRTLLDKGNSNWPSAYIPLGLSKLLPLVCRKRFALGPQWLLRALLVACLVQGETGPETHGPCLRTSPLPRERSSLTTQTEAGTAGA